MGIGKDSQAMHHNQNEDLFLQFAKTRSSYTRSQLAQANQRLVFREAHRFLGKNSDALEDLISVGNVGLLKAIDEFDPSRGYKFSSYAVSKIKGELLHHLRDKDHSGLLSIPRRYSEAVPKIKNIQRELIAAGHSGDVEKIALSLGFSSTDAQWIAQYLRGPQIAELSTELEAEEPEAKTSEVLLEAIAQLPRQERESMLLHYYGGEEPVSIARLLQLTVEEVERILQSAVMALRELLGGRDEYAI